MSVPQTSTCQLEAVLGVGPDPAALTDPARLDEWLCSHVAATGDRAACVIEEEYGYRRHLDWRIERHEAGRYLALVAERVERAWDGSDGRPVGPPSPAQRWAEPELVGSRLAIEVDDDAALVRWDTFAGDARDACRRQGLAVWFAVERAVEAGLLAFGVPCVEVRQVAAGHAWFGDAPLLVGQPGERWARGRVLVATCERRLVASCGDGMLDVRVERQRGSAALLRAAFLPAGGTAAEASAWLADVAEALARGTSIVELDA